MDAGKRTTILKYIIPCVVPGTKKTLKKKTNFGLRVKSDKDLTRQLK